MTPEYFYTLPRLDFVGGVTLDLAFRCLHRDGNTPRDMSDCVANFAVVDYNNKKGKPLISLSMDVQSENGVKSLLHVKIPSFQTSELCGKYIYQITIRCNDGLVEIPNQGIFLIHNNIDRVFTG